MMSTCIPSYPSPSMSDVSALCGILQTTQLLAELSATTNKACSPRLSSITMSPSLLYFKHLSCEPLPKYTGDLLHHTSQKYVKLILRPIRARSYECFRYTGEL
ncbi:hypothetical protein H2248_003467 [Termitomyces sp. 'cryptogamus']|nr:hypothetical protein H2248_003467 [Termitomyces sp. 'cryptogamus']